MSNDTYRYQNELKIFCKRYNVKAPYIVVAGDKKAGKTKLI